jgi:hypothetical protein
VPELLEEPFILKSFEYRLKLVHLLELFEIEGSYHIYNEIWEAYMLELCSRIKE